MRLVTAYCQMIISKVKQLLSLGKLYFISMHFNVCCPSPSIPLVSDITPKHLLLQLLPYCQSFFFLYYKPTSTRLQLEWISDFRSRFTPASQQVYSVKSNVDATISRYFTTPLQIEIKHKLDRSSAPSTSSSSPPPSQTKPCVRGDSWTSCGTNRSRLDKKKRAQITKTWRGQKQQKKKKKKIFCLSITGTEETLMLLGHVEATGGSTERREKAKQNPKPRGGQRLN